MDDYRNEYQLPPPSYTVDGVANVNHIGEGGGISIEYLYPICLLCGAVLHKPEPWHPETPKESIL